MAKLENKWLADDAVDGSKVKLNNAESLRARNAADNGDVNLFSLDASDQLVFDLQPEYAIDPSADNHLARKKYVDDQIAGISLPTTFELQGNWNASTNTPALADTDTGVDNYLYLVSVSGTQDLGSGSNTYSVGDWVYYANSQWIKKDNVDDVLSVNGEVGIVVLDTGDVAENGNLYYTQGRFDTAFAAKDTDDLSEGGVTNFYHTTARARAAAVDDTAYAVSWDGVTDQAPSKNAVYDKFVTVDAAIAAAGSSQGREVRTLVALDISNGYIDLAQEALASSLHVTPVGGLEQEPTVDYTESVPAAVTRVTFAGDLAAELVAGDKLIFHYEY